jgi:hypothetical protein
MELALKIHRRRDDDRRKNAKIILDCGHATPSRWPCNKGLALVATMLSHKALHRGTHQALGMGRLSHTPKVMVRRTVPMDGDRNAAALYS